MTCGEERNSTGSPCMRTKSEIEKPANGRVGAEAARRHVWQWQMPLARGSPSTLYRMVPHRQPPSLIAAPPLRMLPRTMYIRQLRGGRCRPPFTHECSSAWQVLDPARAEIGGKTLCANLNNSTPRSRPKRFNGLRHAQFQCDCPLWFELDTLDYHAPLWLSILELTDFHRRTYRTALARALAH